MLGGENMQEIWKTIENFENYEISNKGNIRSKKNGLLKPQINRSGYKEILLYKKQPPLKTLVKSFRIHRLVLQTFNPIKNPEKMQVNHIDHNKSNNNIAQIVYLAQCFIFATL